jgi:hypothetical protein
MAGDARYCPEQTQKFVARDGNLEMLQRADPPIRAFIRVIDAGGLDDELGMRTKQGRIGREGCRGRRQIHEAVPLFGIVTRPQIGCSERSKTSGNGFILGLISPRSTMVAPMKSHHFRA